MSPDGKIKELAEFMAEEEKSKKELLKEGYFDLADDEVEFLKDIPEEKRYDALLVKRRDDVMKVAYEQKQETDRKNRKPKETKRKRKLIKEARRKNRKRK